MHFNAKFVKRCTTKIYSSLYLNKNVSSSYISIMKSTPVTLLKFCDDEVLYRNASYVFEF